MTSSVDAHRRPAVSMVVPPFSATTDGLTARRTTWASSSVMVRVAGLTVIVTSSLVPVTLTCLSGAWVALSVAVRVTAPVLSVVFAGIVSVWFALSVKSSAVAGAIAAAATVTVRALIAG